MFDWINIIFLDVLNWIYSWIGNYGWAVVVFTLLIRVCVLPLEIKSRRSMRAISRVQPKLMELQRKYGDDRDRLAAKQMELYRKEKVSPMSGCLPLLLQWPILIFMFTAMRVIANEQTIQMILNLKNGLEPTFESWLWIKNVFQPDSFVSTILPAVGDKLSAITAVSYSNILTAENIEIAREFLASSEYAVAAVQYGANAFTRIQLNFFFFAPILTLPTSLANMFQYGNGLFILPLLAGASQFFMTKITAMGTTAPKPEPVNGQQAAQNDPANMMNSGFMKWFFPLFSLWICATSNSAFSIYWMAVNVIMIIQTVVLNRVLDREDAKKEAAKDAAAK